MKKQIMTIVLAVVAMAAMSAKAEDTRDYSTYTRLELTNEQNYNQTSAPDADMTNPENTKSYLVPQGFWFKCVPSGSTAFTWYGTELAIEGTFQIHSVSGVKRSGNPTLPPLALLPGGMLLSTRGYDSIISSELDIRGTSANPSVIKDTSGDYGVDKYF